MLKKRAGATVSERAKGVVADKQGVIGCDLFTGDVVAVHHTDEQEGKSRKHLKIQRMAAMGGITEPYDRET